MANLKQTMVLDFTVEACHITCTGGAENQLPPNIRRPRLVINNPMIIFSVLTDVFNHVIAQKNWTLNLPGGFFTLDNLLTFEKIRLYFWLLAVNNALNQIRQLDQVVGDLLPEQVKTKEVNQRFLAVYGQPFHLCRMLLSNYLAFNQQKTPLETIALIKQLIEYTPDNLVKFYLKLFKDHPANKFSEVKLFSLSILEFLFKGNSNAIFKLDPLEFVPEVPQLKENEDWNKLRLCVYEEANQEQVLLSDSAYCYEQALACLASNDNKPAWIAQAAEWVRRAVLFNAEESQLLEFMQKAEVLLKINPMFIINLREQIALKSEIALITLIEHIPSGQQIAYASLFARAHWTARTAERAIKAYLQGTFSSSILGLAAMFNYQLPILVQALQMPEIMQTIDAANCGFLLKKVERAVIQLVDQEQALPKALQNFVHYANQFGAEIEILAYQPFQSELSGFKQVCQRMYEVIARKADAGVADYQMLAASLCLRENTLFCEKNIPQACEYLYAAIKQQGDYPEAVAMLQQAYASNPCDELNYCLGKIYLEKADLAEAYFYLSQLSSQSLRYVEAMMECGNIAFFHMEEENALLLAIDFYTKALAAGEQDAEVMLTAAKLKLEGKKVTMGAVYQETAQFKCQLVQPLGQKLEDEFPVVKESPVESEKVWKTVVQVSGRDLAPRAYTLFGFTPDLSDEPEYHITAQKPLTN